LNQGSFFFAQPYWSETACGKSASFWPGLRNGRSSAEGMLAHAAHSATSASALSLFE
jgi:hypothetical protein